MDEYVKRQLSSVPGHIGFYSQKPSHGRNGRKPPNGVVPSGQRN